MPARSLRLLLGGCFATTSWGCAEKRAEFFDLLAGRDLLTQANDAMYPPLKTSGSCTVASAPDLQPCQSGPVHKFSGHTQGKDWEFTVPYFTGLDTFSMTNVSLRCAPGEPGLFVELDGTIRDLGISVTAHVREKTNLRKGAGPKMETSVLERFANLTARVVASVSCVSGTSLRLQPDLAEGSLTLSAVEIGTPFFHVDYSHVIIQALRTLLQGLTFTPPASWGALMPVVCAATTPELEASLVI